VIEPTVEELLNDPIARLLMTRDGLTQEIVHACISDARRKVKVREWHEHGAVEQVARVPADLVA
jgi:hypothetical protein